MMVPTRGARKQRASIGEPERTDDLEHPIDESPYRDADEAARALPGQADVDDDTRGFQLRRLLVLGTHAPPAELRFTAGLNVIAGPSDTGKSFAFECIDYMLGRRDRPRELDRAKSYDRVVLELEATRIGGRFTAERPLVGGKVRWYKCGFDEISKDTPFETLGEVHSSTNKDTLSFRLLELCGLAGRQLRKNKNNVTRSISVRNVVRLTMVDEERVITKGSPALGTQKTDETADKALFRLLLTGRDDSALVELADTIESRRRLEAQADLLDGILGPEPSKEASHRLDAAELSDRRIRLHKHIDDLNERAELSAGDIEALAAEGNQVFADVQEAKSRVLVIDELLKRFALLRASYETDLQRLTFIAEGHHYFAQLSAVTCPACSRPLDEADHVTHQFCEAGSGLADDIQAACAHEAAKIRVHLGDLTSAVVELQQEREQVVERLHSGSLRQRELSDMIEKQLRPKLTETMRELRRFVAMRETIVQQEAALDHRSTIMAKRIEIAHRLQALEAAPNGKAHVEDAPYDEFAAEAGVLLRAWGYEDAEHVVFDTGAMDLVIDGEPRASHGKGVRAIMLAAFVLGLMRFCRSQGLPHPGFVVLDSPLTTYRARDQQAGPTAGDDEVSVDMQRAFFEDLAASTRVHDEQIIVFENKEPPSEVLASINYISFSGVKSGTGRTGFLPD